VTLNPGGTLSLTGGATGGLTIGGTLGIGGTSASNLDFALSSTGADVLSVTGAVSFGTVGGDINLTSLAGGTAPAFGTMFNLITSTAGDLVPADFTLETTALNIDGTNYTVTLSASTASDEIVTLNQNNVALNFYLTGTDGSSWSKIDTFATDHTGATAQTGSLSSTSNVFLTANSPVNYTSETLDGNYTINSLSFTAAATSPITLANGTATAPLTIEAGSTFSDAANNIYGTGIGLVVQSGAVGHTISANINLGSSQTWEIDNSSVNALTVSGTIGNGSTNDSLTKTGVGTLILSASNTYSGGTIVDAGTVALGTNNALLSTGALTVTGTGGPGGTFDMAGFNQTVGTLSDGGTNTGTVTSSSGTPTLTLNNASTFSGTISGGLALAVNNNLTLSASNSYTGGTTLNAGTLAVSNNYALGGSGTTGLVLDPSASATVQFTSASPTIGSLASSGVGTSSVVLGNSAAPSATTLTIGGAGATTVFGGVISDLTLTNAAAIGNLTVSGGTLTLGGADTFTGTTIISSGGTLVLGNALALQDSTLNYNNQGGTLSLGTQTAMTLAGLTGAQNLALTNTNSAAVAFTIGNNNVTSSYTGVLSGSGSLTKVGSGTFSISNADYIGATTVNAGILTISGGSVGSPTSALSINVGGVALNLTGGMLTAGTVDVGTAGGATGAGVSITGAASASFASLQIGSSGNTGGAVTINTTGTVSLGNYIMGRDGGSGGGASATGGLIIDAGTVTATTIAGGSGVGGRSADINLSGGSFTIGTSASTGAFQLGGTGAVGSDYLTQTGGSLTYLGTDGLVAGALAGTTSGITINGATTVDTLTGVTLNSGNSATTIAALTVGTNATLYLGSAGLVENLPGLSGTGVAVNFGTATVGAIAPWSSAANINLTGNTTFQAADSLGNPNNITLTGTLSGAGGLTTSGAGTVTIANTGSYAGATTVTQGNLVVSGSITGTSAITVSPGANLEVDYLISGASAPAVSGQLSGTGVINGATITSGTLAPGLTLANRTSAVGALTSGGNVTLGSNSTFGIRLGLTNGSSTDVDSLNMAGGSFNLTDSTTTLQLNVGAAEANESLLDTIYTIVNGGASATGVSGDWFANAPGQGDSVTASNGYIFDVYYGVQPGSTITAGNDINVELIAEVPEPGTWASLLGGIGMLVAWQRSRRRRHE
jgi:autotransporter-associated beta strand protein